MTLAHLKARFRNRVSYRVTGGGALFGLALALTGTTALMTGNNLLFLVFSAMLSLLLLSGFYSRLMLSGLELELFLPEHVCAKSATSARIRLRNLKRLTPSFSIELSQTGALSGTKSILTGPLYFPIIRGGAVVEAAVDVVFGTRGRHRENVFLVATRFPFGFLRKSTALALQRETIVYPAIAPFAGGESLAASILGGAEMPVRGFGLTHRLRPYEPGDGARYVDWKATAHTGVMQVREFAREQRLAVEIFFDRRVPAGAPSDFEQRIEQCAWLVTELADSEIEIFVRSQGFSWAIPEDGEFYVVLKYLALVEAVMVGGLPTENPQDASSVKIVFSAHPKDFIESGWATAYFVDLSLE